MGVSFSQPCAPGLPARQAKIAHSQGHSLTLHGQGPLEQIGQTASTSATSSILKVALGGAAAAFVGKRRGVNSTAKVCRGIQENSSAANETAVQVGASIREPTFVSVLSTNKDWKSAVREVQAEATRLLGNHTGATWSFGIAYVCGHEDASVTDITLALDAGLGTDGSMIGTAVEACSGRCADGTVKHIFAHEGPALLLTAIHVPSASAIVKEAEQAKPFFVGKQGLLEISKLVCRMQDRMRGQHGKEESATPRAWREYLGVGSEKTPRRGIILFADSLASKYTMRTVFGALDMAFPQAVKFGGVCADLPPSRSRLCVAAYHRKAAGSSEGTILEEGIAGLILPSSLSLHTIVSPGCVSVGPELRVTSADGQVINKMGSNHEKDDHSAAEVMAAITKEADPQFQRLIERSGFLLGFEAPAQLDHDKAKVFDDYWGSSERAPSYTSLAKQAGNSDWLVRRLEPLPSGAVVVHREDLKRVPPRVGPRWLRCKLHVPDDRWARSELKLMVQRYMGARLTLAKPVPPLAVLSFSCATWAANAQKSGKGEVARTELQEVFGQAIPFVGVSGRGEVAASGISLATMNSKPTVVQCFTASSCIISYSRD